MGEIRVKVERLRLINGAFYWRPTPAVRALGFENMALGQDPQAAIERAKQLNEAVARAKRGRPAEPTRGTVAAVIRDYCKSQRYIDLAPSTQYNYRLIMKEIETKAGDIAVASISRQDIKQTYLQMQKRGMRIAQEHMKVWRLLLGHAYDTGLRADNPALKLGIKQPKARRQLWTWDQVMMFAGAALEMGRPSMFMAAMLAYATAQRPGDVRLLPRTKWDGECFTLRQSKTDKLIALDVEPWLRPTLDRWPKRGIYFVLSEETDRPYTRTNMAHVFAKIRAAAGLPDALQMRDLRRTALTEANAGGATTGDLQGLGGHSTLQTLPVYVLPTSESSARAQRGRNEGRVKVAKMVETGEYDGRKRR